MPTPSPNQPPNPPSPPSISSSTCPDDVQAASRPNRQRSQPHTSHDVNMSPRMSTEAAQDTTTRSIQASISTETQVDETASDRTDRLMLVDEQTSIEPSSRGTTMSPAPHSIATARTSPIAPSIDDEMPKQILVDAPVSTISREHSASLRRRAGTPEATRQTAVGTINRSRPATYEEPRVEDSIPSLTMGSGYSSSRVSTAA